MKSRLILFVAPLIAAFFSPLFSQAADPAVRQWKVDGVEREALVAAPDTAAKTATPLVFVFHGHGGTMRNAARSFRIHNEWPEAIVVYMQGLKTPGQITDPQGLRTGWQTAPQDQGDRDLKFFDQVLESMKKDFKIDDKRIYATGHSNGGSFTYILWNERPDVFAAFAPSGSAALKLRGTLKPKPMLHVAGENDPLVKYAWQKMMIESVKTTNKCGEGKPWAKSCTEFSSTIDSPVVTFITSGGHEFPKEAPALIVKFFKQHPIR